MNVEGTTKSLVLAYNLCRAASACQTVLREHLNEGLFRAGVTEYYSNFRGNAARDMLLRKFKAPAKGMSVRLRRVTTVFEGRNDLGEELARVFKLFEKRWMDGVVGKSRQVGWEGPPVWMELPDGVGGTETGRGRPYIALSTGGIIAPEEKDDFLTLVEVTLDLYWYETLRAEKQEEEKRGEKNP